MGGSGSTIPGTVGRSRSEVQIAEMASPRGFVPYVGDPILKIAA